MTEENELVVRQMRHMAAKVETPRPPLSSTLQRARRRVVRRRAVAAAALVGVAAAAAAVIVPSIDTDGSLMPVATSIEPRDMSAGPLSARSDMTAVAVDGGVFYWGGITSVTQGPEAMCPWP